MVAELAVETISHPPDSLQKCDKNLALFNSNTGGLQGISDLRAWIEIMSITGLYHGSTMSLTRLVLTHSFWVGTKLNPGDAKIKENNAQAMSRALATISGMQEGRHVFSSTLFGEDAPFPPHLKFVLKKYDYLSSKFKREYFDRCRVDQDDFINFGWIYSDYFLNGFDGKQMTITTYI